MKIQNRAGLAIRLVEQLSEGLKNVESLSDVLKWGRSASSGAASPSVITDVVVQDEFTHDALVPWQSGQALVFAST